MQLQQYGSLSQTYLMPTLFDMPTWIENSLKARVRVSNALTKHQDQKASWEFIWLTRPY